MTTTHAEYFCGSLGVLQGSSSTPLQQKNLRLDAVERVSFTVPTSPLSQSDKAQCHSTLSQAISPTWENKSM